MNCERCGIEIDEATILRRKYRGDENKTCLDCRMKPAKRVKKDKMFCIPWAGQVDDDFNPLDNKGRLYKPGIRTCNHKDCVLESHIISPLEAERFDISYRTKQPFDYKKLVREAI